MEYVKQFLPDERILPNLSKWLYYKIFVERKSNSENVGTVEESVLL